MPRKASKKEKTETEVVKKAGQTKVKDKQLAGSRRFTPQSFSSRRKRRKAEKVVARTKVAGSFNILGRSILVLRNHWEIFGSLFLIFAVVNTILTAGSLLRLDLESVKSALIDTADIGQIGTGLTLYGTLITTGAGMANGAAGAYQMLLMVIMSLAIVWALRQLSGGNAIRVRDALFNSSYPLVQLLIVMLVLFLQLLPLLAGSYLYYNLISLEVVVVDWQEAIVTVGCLLLGFWSIYMTVSTLIALYVVTLPGMTPLKALRAAKDIVRYRRAMVFRKIVFLPLAVLVVDIIILVPLSLASPRAGTIAFFVMAMATLPLAHAYMYTLYRELINS